MALTLGELAPAGTDLDRVVRLLLVHDLVEIEAGDLHFDADPQALSAQRQAEEQAAALVFGQLPPEQAGQLRALWQEFEERRTVEARFARALDAFQPMLLTWGPGGRGCLESAPELTRSRVLALKEKHLREFPPLWEAAQGLLEQAQDGGLLI